MGQIVSPIDKQNLTDQFCDPVVSKLNGRDALRAKIVERELKRPGYKAKIRAFCCHCIYDPYQEGTWLKQVGSCTSLDCPLYSVRPLPHSERRVQ